MVVLLPCECYLTNSSSWETWEMLMLCVVQKTPWITGWLPKGSNGCQAEVHRSDFLFPGATDDQMISFCTVCVKHLPFSRWFWWPLCWNGKIYPEWGIWIYATISEKGTGTAPCRGAISSFKPTDLGYILIRWNCLQVWGLSLSKPWKIMDSWSLKTHALSPFPLLFQWPTLNEASETFIQFLLVLEDLVLTMCSQFYSAMFGQLFKFSCWEYPSVPWFFLWIFLSFIFTVLCKNTDLMALLSCLQLKLEYAICIGQVKTTTCSV